MKILLLVFMLLGLGLSSCEKEENIFKDEDLIEVNGKMYSIEFLTLEMAKGLDVPVDLLIFHKDELVFTVVDYPESKFSVYKIINNL